MADIIDLKIKIGNSSMYLNECPCVVDSPTPIVTWELPQSISQVRYNVKISAVEGGGLLINGSQAGQNTSFQFPTTNPMSSRFLGLCTVEVAISENESGEYEYSSGAHYFIFDNVAEVISKHVPIVFRWSNSLDIESPWQDITYQLMVSSSPTFEENSILFDGMVNPTSRTKTSYMLNLEHDFPFFYWRVRSFDGLDYSAFTPTHGFSVSDNLPPEVTIREITVLNNETRDVVIEVNIEDSASDIITLEVYYNGGTAGETYQSAFVLYGLINVKPGNYFLIWRSSFNEKKIQSDDYNIKIVAVDREGLHGMDTSTTFSMNNLAVGVDSGGDGSISNNFILSCYMATKTERDIGQINHLVSGNMFVSSNYFDVPSGIKSSMETWRIYRAGDLNKDFDTVDRTVTENNISRVERLSYPLGMRLFQISDIDGTDLNGEDPDFVVDINHVDSNGRYRELTSDVPYTSFGEYRGGYVKFNVELSACSFDLCTGCGGKGWKQSELVVDHNVPDEHIYKYKRVPCSTCGGHRFIRGNYQLNEQGEYNLNYSKYTLAKYVPIREYFSPLRVPEIFDSAKITGRIIDPMINFYFGSQGFTTNPNNIPNNDYYQTAANTVNNTGRYGIDGVYDGVLIKGKMAVKQQRTASKEDIIVNGNLKFPPEYVEEDVSPIYGYIKEGYQNYNPGMTYDEPIFMRNRKVPTHKWEPGLFKIAGSLYREEEITSHGLRIIFLQPSWSTYNTIHWIGPGSVNTMTQIQYCEVFGEGISGEYRDVISENATYNTENSVWLINPLTWHTYWRTSNQIPYDLNRKYRLRIRQFNLVSNTFSQWVYGQTTFVVADVLTNPANIFYVEYMKFSKTLYIYFRLDDPNGQSYNITRVWYSADGNIFSQIAEEDISGELSNLSSIPGTSLEGRANNEHLIVWDTKPYNLAAGDNYRIRIEVIPTRYVNGFSKPILNWKKTPNTTSDSRKRTVEQIEGVWQEYVFDPEKNKIVKLDEPFFVNGELYEYQEELESVKRENPPLPETEHGYYSFMEDVSFGDDESNSESDSDSGSDSSSDSSVEETINVRNPTIKNSIIVNGQEYKFYDWLSYKRQGESESRNTRMSVLGDEIKVFLEMVENAKDDIRENCRHVRRQLIDQGYYCNGFKNNIPSNGKFVFEVIQYFEDVVDEDGMFIPTYNEIFGDSISSYQITNPDDTVDTFDIHEYERTNEIFSHIQLDQMSTFNSANGRPMRDFIVIDGERIGSEAGGESLLESNITKETESPYEPMEGDESSNYNPVSSSSTRQSSYNTFKIPIEYLPGEMDGDVSVWGSFEGKYPWRVSSYNLLYGRPFEQPMFAAEHQQGASNNLIELFISCFGDRDILTVGLTGIYYIDEFLSSYSASSVEEVDFKTDPPDSEIVAGNCYDFDWTPLSKERNRPIIFIDDKHQRHLWYTNSGIYNSKVIVYAKSKNSNGFADYNTAIPFNNIYIGEEFNNADAAFGHTVIYRSSVYIMYFILKVGQDYSVMSATSTDGHSWNISETQGIGVNCYNLFARTEGNYIVLYYCCYENGKSIVRKTFSTNGNSFFGSEIFFEGTNDVSSIFILKHGDEDVLFYTDVVEVGGNVVYTIKNSSNGIFPIVNNATSLSIIREGHAYRVYYDSGNKLYTCLWKNYEEKPILNSWTNKGGSISGLIDAMPCSENAEETKIIINKQSNYYGNYHCTEAFRNIGSGDILGWVITGQNNASVKEFRVEGEWLDGSNYNTYGYMDPYPFDYSLLSKELGYM